MAGNLPTWPGADAVYSKAYRVLESMARRGHATPAATHGRRVIVPGAASPEMRDLIDALGRGDEERIKGLLLIAHVYH